MIDVSRLVTRVTDLAVSASDGEFGGDYRVTETETLRFDRPESLVVDGENGSVTVQSDATAPAGEITVEATKRAETRGDLGGIAVESSRNGSRLRLAVVTDDDIDAAVDLSISVPDEVSVERVATCNGEVVADGVAVEGIETQNGSVTLSDTVGDTRVETKNGSVTAERADGFLDVTTANGSVTVRDAAGIDGIETKAGSIDAEIAAIRGDTTIQSRVGSVGLRADAALDADVTLTTNLGRLDAPAFDTDGAGAGKVQATGTVGDGGERLRVETRVGKIEFEVEADRTR